MGYSAAELVRALNEKLAVRVVDMTAVVEAGRATKAQLLRAVARKPGVGLLLLDEGAATKRMVAELTTREEAFRGALLLHFEDGTLGVVPIVNCHVLAVAVRKVCDVVGGVVGNCPICLEALGTGAGKCLPCGHGLHPECIRSLVKASRCLNVDPVGVECTLFHCPECRTEYGMSGVDDPEPVLWSF